MRFCATCENVDYFVMARVTLKARLSRRCLLARVASRPLRVQTLDYRRVQTSNGSQKTSSRMVTPAPC